jgi:hypothetical protein
LTSSSQLAELQNQFRSISKQAEALVVRLGEERVVLRPAPDKWSVAECLVHLAMTTDAFLPRWKEAMANVKSARRSSDGRPLKMDLWGRILLWTLEPPPRFRVSTTPQFQPNYTGPADQVLSMFLQSQDRLLGIIAEADGLPIDTGKVVSPFSRHVRYNVWSSFCVSAAHQRRHLWQAERVAEGLEKEQSTFG